MKARVIGNPYNLGNGYYPVGQIVEIERETAHYYVLVNSCYRISKKTLALTGWAGRYAHTIEFEIIADAPDTAAPAPVAMNTEILIATTAAEAETARQVADVAECLGSLGPVSKDYEPISETVARVFARLPVGVAVRDALDRLGDLPFVLTAYPVGAQDMAPAAAKPSHLQTGAGGLPLPWVYQCGQSGQSGEDYRHSREAWRQEVEDGNTQRGYWEWVDAQIEETEDAADLEVRQALADGLTVVMVDRALVGNDEELGELQYWLNEWPETRLSLNGEEFRAFPGDVTTVIGTLPEGRASALEREILGWLAEREGESLPHAVVSVGTVWNARDVPALSLAGVINEVAACYSGITLELGENAPNANGLVIRWDRTPGEVAEREIRAALVAALNKMADALPKCSLSLAVPLEWNGRTVDRARLAAWCGRQGGNDFALALAVVPGARLALHWVTGPRPVAGLEAGILADARTWLDELGALEDEDAAEPVDLDDVPAEPASVTKCSACTARIVVPKSWNGYAVNREPLQAWALDTLGPLFPSVEFDVVTGDRQQSDGVAVKLTSRAEPSALVFPGRTAARDGILAYVISRLDEVYPGL